MNTQAEYILHVRLKNCLQTILELEPHIHALESPLDFRADMMSLRTCLDRIEKMPLAEEDVARFESATEHLLEELRIPISTTASFAHTRVLQ